MEKTINDKSERIFIGKAYIRYLIPAALAMIFGQLAPLVDSVCVSAKLGDTALSAFSTVSPVYYFFNIIAVLGGMGGGIGIAKASGAGEKKSRKDVHGCGDMDRRSCDCSECALYYFYRSHPFFMRNG